MAEPDRRLTHHDLCFGCGPANLFGLQLELERTDEGGVEGRFFVKQDHQGPPGFAHGGVLAAALDEAMALLLFDQGAVAVTARLEVDLRAPAPVGAFVVVSARVARDRGAPDRACSPRPPAPRSHVPCLPRRGACSYGRLGRAAGATEASARPECPQAGGVPFEHFRGERGGEKLKRNAGLGVCLSFATYAVVNLNESVGASFP